MKRILISMFLAAYFIAGTNICFAQVVVTPDSVQTVDMNLESAKKPVIPSGRIILAEMKTHNPEMFSQYNSAKKKQRTGIIMTSAGGGVFLIGAIFSIIPDFDGTGTVSVGPFKVAETDGNNSGLRTAGTVLMVGGAACLTVGLPVMISGGKKKKQTFQDFKNQHYVSQQSSSYFQMNVYSHRVGIAYVF